MKHVAIFVHYNKKGSLAEHCLYTLQSIRPLFDKIVIISNSQLNEKNTQILSSHCDELVFRENKGYDFGAWRDGIKKIGWKNLQKYQTLTLLNDTNYFPLFPIEEVFKKYNSDKKIDFWGGSIHSRTRHGMPGSDGPVPEHIQSFFITFKRSVISSPAFQDFWGKVKNHSNVHEVINKYETRMTSELSDAGFRYDALYNPENYNDTKITDAVYEIPDKLIRRGFPFLKLKAVSHNNRHRITKELKLAKSAYPTKLIKNNTNAFQSFLQYFIKNTHLLFLVIGIPSAIAFMLMTPVGFGGDEESHTYRAYHISTGHMYPENLRGDLPVSLVNAVKEGYSTADTSPFGAPAIDRHDLGNGIDDKLRALADAPLNPDATQNTQFIKNTYTYTPTMFLGAAFGFKLSTLFDASVGQSVFLARLMNSIPFFAISALALYVVRSSKLRWLIFFTLLLPTVISYVATINGDPYNIACILLFFALFIKFSTSPKIKLGSRNIGLLIMSSILLAFAKLPSVLVVLLMALIPRAGFDRAKKSKWVITACTLFIVGSLTLAPMVIVSDSEYSSNMKHQLKSMLSNPLDSVKVYKDTLLLHSPDYINRSVGVMGRNGVYVHSLFITLIVICFVILGLWLDKINKKIALVSLAFGTFMCFLVITLLYLGDNVIGSDIAWGIHGKYFTPFIPMIVYGLTALPLRIEARANRVEYGVICIVVILLISSIFTFLKALY